MSLTIKYDLSEKVNTSNGILNKKPILLKDLRNSALYFGLLTSLNIASGREDGIRWLSNLMLTSGIFMIFHNNKIDAAQEKKEDKKMDASFELIDLLNELKDKLDIHTDLDLLKGSRVAKVEHRWRDSGIPLLQENKYILIPRYVKIDDTNIPNIDKSNVNIQETFVLQEHILLSDEYILSLRKPK